MQYTNYDFLTVSEAADLLETKDTYVYTLIRKGLLVPASRQAATSRTFPRSWFYPRYGERNSCSPSVLYDR